MTKHGWWPDRRPVPTGRQTLWAVASSVAMVLAPVLLDPFLAATWRGLWMFPACGVALFAQAGMELARPDPTDRTAVVVYRTTHLALPFVVVFVVMAFALR